MKSELFDELGKQIESLISNYAVQIVCNDEDIKGLYFWQFNKKRDLIDRNGGLRSRQQILKIINTVVLIFFQ